MFTAVDYGLFFFTFYAFLSIAVVWPRVALGYFFLRYDLLMDNLLFIVAAVVLVFQKPVDIEHVVEMEGPATVEVEGGI